MFHGGSSFRKFSNFFVKIPKMPKIVPKSIQTCFERVLGQTFGNFLCPVFRGGSSFRKFSQKTFSKFQKCPKVFSKVSKRVLNMFWGKIFLKNFMPSVPWRVESSKIFLKIKKILKIPKMPKSVPKSIQKCFSVIFSKKIYAQCSMEGRVFENFQFFFQNSKKAQNRSQKYPNVF